jgi:LPS-assembly protein
MNFRPRLFADMLPRPAMVRVVVGFLLAISTGLMAAPAQATLLPPGFFDMMVAPSKGAAAVEADTLSFNAQTNVISAEGDVLLSFGGTTIHADRLEYNQTTNELHASGSVVISDGSGNTFEMDSIDVTGEMKQAFIKSLTITTSVGAVVTADSIEYKDALATMLTEATYSPCGLCIDSKGRKIGWKVKAARMIYDREKASVILEGPSLELLGIPVAWIPWLWVPDPTQPRAQGMRFPTARSSATRGLELTVPYFVPLGEDADLLLSGTLMSKQGFMPRGELTWRLPEYGGVIEVKAHGLYQFGRAEFAGQQGDRDWRGAIQTSGKFIPKENWTAGWSYAVFSDNAYLSDYQLTDAKSNTNEVYATYLTQETWFDARIQRFNRIGNVAPIDDERQGMNLPKVEVEHAYDLAPGWGRLHLKGELLGVRRGLDHLAGPYGAGMVPYVVGYEGLKLHGMLEGAWENQVILPGGLAATPYLGLRLDAATYNRSPAAVPTPAPYPSQANDVLFSATPIAALDLRYPLMMTNGADVHLIEPIAQIVYRGSGTTKVGITNDDAHSFVFDTSNLFSYNRFSGIDRQETGLRANVGAHYLGTFGDGSWLDLVAGQSFHLAGVNAYGIGDQMQVGTSTGLGGTNSFVVGSARYGTSWGLSGGAKAQVDPSTWGIKRAGVGFDFRPPGQWYTLGSDYIYLAANPALGIDDDEHEIKVRASIKIADYYTLSGSSQWNIDDSLWTRADGNLTYSDGFLTVGGGLYATPTSWGLSLSTFTLRDPMGLAF